MPSIVGAVKILSLGTSAVVQFGDCIQINPSSTSKTYSGAGSFLTGDLPVTNNGISATNTNDPDVADSNSTPVNTGTGGVA
ncbi:spore germination protein [Cohnella zeiphila]|uniref:Spore germination protein n=1 Tax=Cohnella zeiphila TaxID=2761120 RepID=A0A7X0VVN6_9BACL|nr:spore germination protein [Cohnella zeiphila]MBB6731605.1 spore germination protein [Cohnella zeiphila]